MVMMVMTPESVLTASGAHTSPDDSLISEKPAYVIYGKDGNRATFSRMAAAANASTVTCSGSCITTP